MAGEGLRDPRVLVGPVPNGDPDATGDGHTRRDDGGVVGLLLGEQGRRRRERHADVEFRDGDLEAKRGELLHALDERCRDLADDEVALEADAVNRDALLLQRRHEVLQCGRFST